MSEEEARKIRGKRAQLRHDKFNLVLITPLVVLTLISVALSTTPRVDAALSWGIVVYIVLDTIYNCIAPEIQPNTLRLATILLHHAATAWLCFFPITHYHLGYLTGMASIVEVNTLVLTVGKLGWKSSLQQAFFYASWVSMRLIWYPYFIYYAHKVVVRGEGYQVGSYQHLQTVGTLTILTGLNYFWTLEIVVQMFAKKKKRNVSKTS